MDGSPSDSECHDGEYYKSDGVAGAAVSAWAAERYGFTIVGGKLIFNLLQGALRGGDAYGGY